MVCAVMFIKKSIEDVYSIFSHDLWYRNIEFDPPCTRKQLVGLHFTQFTFTNYLPQHYYNYSLINQLQEYSIYIRR